MFHFDFTANIWFQNLTRLISQLHFWFSKFPRLILSLHVWFSKRGRLISQMTLLISEICRVWFINWRFWFLKLVSFDFSIPKFVAFDLPNGTFDFRNLSRLISKICRVWFLHVTVSVGGKPYSRMGGHSVSGHNTTRRGSEGVVVKNGDVPLDRLGIGFGFPKGGFVLSVLNRDIYLWRQQSNHIFTGQDKLFGEKGK